MPAQITNTMNAFETTLSSTFGANDLTMNITEVAEFPAVPCYLVLDPLGDQAGREYIFFDGSASATSYTTTTLDNRYLERSSATGGLSHPAGTVVRMSPMQQHIDDLNARIDLRMETSEHTKGLHESLGISHDSLSDTNSGDPHTQYLTASRHNSLAHNDKLTVNPAGKKLTVGATQPTSPALHDIWIDTN